MRFALKTLALGAVAAFVAASASAQTTTTYNSTGPTPILDVATVTSTIVVPASDFSAQDGVRDINVAINITHTWDSDLTVTLLGPDGTEVGLWSNVGGSADNFNVTIDDEAAQNINATTGTFRPKTYPSEALCEYDDKTPSGTWTLKIDDTVGGDSGMLNSWSITMVTNDDRYRAECAAGATVRVKRGLGSHANNGGGNGEDLPPPGQRGR